METQQVKIIIVHQQKTREWHAGKEHGFIDKVLSVNVGVCVCVRTWRLWVSMRWCVSMWCIHVGMCTSLSHRELIPNTNISSYSELWKKIRHPHTHYKSTVSQVVCVCVCWFPLGTGCWEYQHRESAAAAVSVSAQFMFTFSSNHQLKRQFPIRKSRWEHCTLFCSHLVHTAGVDEVKARLV